MRVDNVGLVSKGYTCRTPSLPGQITTLRQLFVRHFSPELAKSGSSIRLRRVSLASSLKLWVVGYWEVTARNWPTGSKSQPIPPKLELMRYRGALKMGHPAVLQQISLTSASVRA